MIPGMSKPVYVIFDVPHLVKNVRNNFQGHDLRIGDSVSRWSHIGTFYDVDKLHSIRLAPRLTDAHIEVSNMSKMRVKYAVQVLSHSVAAGIDTHITTNHTSDFIEKMDMTFDMLNSTLPFREKPARCAITASNHVASQLLGMKEWICQWQFEDVRTMSTIKCVWVFTNLNCQHCVFESGVATRRLPVCLHCSL